LTALLSEPPENIDTMPSACARAPRWLLISSSMRVWSMNGNGT
jgi:hypothetical protein